MRSFLALPELVELASEFDRYTADARGVDADPPETADGGPTAGATPEPRDDVRARRWRRGVAVAALTVATEGDVFTVEWCETTSVAPRGGGSRRSMVTAHRARCARLPTATCCRCSISRATDSSGRRGVDDAVTWATAGAAGIVVTRKLGRNRYSRVGVTVATTQTTQIFDSFSAGVSASRGDLLAAGRPGYSWQLPLPDGSRLLIRQEVASLGPNCPCPHCPPPSQEVWHYNIEYQAPTNGGSRNRSVFNMHAAVWSGTNQACVAVYNVRHLSLRDVVRTCVFSDCFDPDDQQRVQEEIEALALEIQAQLQSAAGMAGQVLAMA